VNGLREPPLAYETMARHVVARVSWIARLRKGEKQIPQRSKLICATNNKYRDL